MSASLVRDILPGPASSDPRMLGASPRAVAFAANAGDPGIWGSDGTEQGTVLLQSFPEATFQSAATSSNQTYFVIESHVWPRCILLWRSNGTAGGTSSAFLDCWTRGGRRDLYGLTDVNGSLYFVNSTFAIFRPLTLLYRVTPTGQVQQIGIVPARATDRFAGVGNTLFFTSQRELWKSDGTRNGTVLVRGFAGGSPDHLTDVNGTLYFTVDDGVHGKELWKSDGPAAGTVLVKDINPGPAAGFDESSGSLTNINGVLYFSATNGQHGVEVWRSDGTAAGTVLVADIQPGPAGSYPVHFTAWAGSVAFAADDGTHGSELWASGGTSATTRLVSDLNPGRAASSPDNLLNLNGLLYFSAEDVASGRELWSSNGTAAGTRLVRDIHPGSASSDPGSLTQAGCTLFFAANDGTHGRELWKEEPDRGVRCQSLGAIRLTPRRVPFGGWGGPGGLPGGDSGDRGFFPTVAVDVLPSLTRPAGHVHKLSVLPSAAELVPEPTVVERVFQATDLEHGEMVGLLRTSRQAQPSSADDARPGGLFVVWVQDFSGLA